MGMSISEFIVVLIVIFALVKPEKLKEFMGKMRTAMNEINKSRNELDQAVQPAKDAADEIVNVGRTAGSTPAAKPEPEKEQAS